MISVPDYNANEKWEYWTDVEGKRWAKVTGRVPVPDHIKRDLRAMFQLDSSEQWLNDGTTDWWAPGWPEWVRKFTWLMRNPFASRYVSTVLLGVQDRNYTVEVTKGNPDPLVVQRDDVGETGWQKATLHLEHDLSPTGAKRRWVSYAGKRLTFYYGCQPSGLFALKWNFPKGLW